MHYPKPNRSFSWVNREQLAATSEYAPGKLATLSKIPMRKLQRIFEKDLGCTPRNMLNGHRLAAACQLLRTGRSVKEVAHQMGFKHPTNFTRYFKVQMGVTPSQSVI